MHGLAFNTAKNIGADTIELDEILGANFDVAAGEDCLRSEEDCLRYLHGIAFKAAKDMGANTNKINKAYLRLLTVVVQPQEGDVFDVTMSNRSMHRLNVGDYVIGMTHDAEWGFARCGCMTRGWIVKIHKDCVDIQVADGHESNRNTTLHLKLGPITKLSNMPGITRP